MKHLKLIKVVKPKKKLKVIKVKSKDPLSRILSMLMAPIAILFIASMFGAIITEYHYLKGIVGENEAVMIKNYLIKRGLMFFATLCLIIFTISIIKVIKITFKSWKS